MVTALAMAMRMGIPGQLGHPPQAAATVLAMAAAIAQAVVTEAVQEMGLAMAQATATHLAASQMVTMIVLAADPVMAAITMVVQGVGVATTAKSS